MARQQSSENRQGSQAIDQRRQTDVQRPQTWPAFSPFAMMRRFVDDFDRLFEGWPRTMSRGGSWNEWAQFSPEIDIIERAGKLVVRADLPGMTKDNVRVEVTENAIVIEGERKHDYETNEGGVYRVERSYGSFRREIPIPEGVNPDTANAKFKDGVLEVTMDAPQLSKKNRRSIEIQSDDTKPGKSAA
jgi:HSP20 family protein